MKKKNRQIVLLTLFAMTLVVAGHSDITSDFKNLWLYKWVYSFHMPLFFFISGFLFAMTVTSQSLKTISFSSFVKKKSIRLLIPFLFINTIIFIIKAGFINDSSLMQNPVEFTASSFIDSTFYNPMGFMWFLPTLFVVFMIVFLLRKILTVSIIKKELYLVAIVIYIILVLIIDYLAPHISFLQISSAIHYSTYFLLGLLYCDYKKTIDIWLRKYWIAIVPAFLVISMTLLFTGLLAAISGIVFSVALALVLEEKCSDRLVKISSLSYAIFLLSYFPQMFIRGPIAHFFCNLNQYILSIISFFSGLLIPIIFGLIFIRLKEKNRRLNKLGLLIGL